MVIRKVDWSLLLIALLFIVLIGMRTAKASPDNCSEASLRGTYGVLEQGTVVGLIPNLPPPPFTAVTAAIPTYDGAGNFAGAYTASFGGVIVHGTFTGRYTVNSDCTYSDEFKQFKPSPGLVFHHAGTITGGGLFREIHYIYTDAGVVISGTAKRTPLGGCSLASLKGTYALLGQGTFTTEIPGLPLPPFPAVLSGIEGFDGEGTFSGSDTVSLGGTTVPATFTATYTVNRDCTYSSVITNSVGLVLHNVGTITGAGMNREVLNIFTDPGLVLVDVLKKQ